VIHVPIRQPRSPVCSRIHRAGAVRCREFPTASASRDTAMI
jgi:hypothetical protein